MKKFIFTTVVFLFLYSAFGQVPKSFKYQAVVRDASGEILANRLISLRITILQDQEDGASIYSEVYDPYATNEFGYVAVNVGTGVVVQGNFNNIIWNQHTYYLKVELDVNGQSNYIAMGTSQILAVPYALYALDVANNDDADPDPSNEIQDLSLVDNILTITKNSNATPISLSKYIGVDTDEQDLGVQIVGSTVQISIERGTGISFNLPTDFVSKASGGEFLGPIKATNIIGNGVLSLQGNFTLSGTSPVQFNSSGVTLLNLPTSGTLASQEWVNQTITSSKSLTTGNIWVGVDNIATPLPASGNGQILIGNGSGLGSFPMSGDASLSSTGSLTLSNSGVVSGSYFRVQVDSKGRVTNGYNPTSLSGFGITDAISTNLSSGNIIVGNSSNIASQVTLSGDASLSSSGVLTLNNTTITPGTYRSVSVDSKGRIYAGTNPTTLAEYGILDALSRNLNNANIYIGNGFNVANQVVVSGDASLANDGTLTLKNSVTAGTYRCVDVNSKGIVIGGTNPNSLSGYGITDALSTTLIEGRILIGNSSNLAASVTMSGEGTLSSSGVFSLSTSGVSSGTYHSVTVDSKGRVTSGSNPTTLSGYGITDAMSTSHAANGISSVAIANWNTAYGWGNHAGLYRSNSYVPAWSEITSKPTTLAGYAISDAMSTSHAANGITTTNITNWNAAVSWGNHAGLYRPIGYVPAWSEITSKPTSLSGYGITDAMSVTHAANAITTTNISNWNTAVSWGDHAGLYRPVTYVPAWSEITSKPTTFSGYGISDGVLTTIQIGDVIKLSPTTIQKTTGQEGDMYIYDDGSERHIFCYLNGSWRRLDN